MKTIENKLIKLNENETITYGEMIMTAVTTLQVNQQGQPIPLQYDDLKKIQRVDSVIGKDKQVQEYQFEDSDFEFVKSKVIDMRWAFYNPEFIKFTDCIKEAK